MRAGIALAEPSTPEHQGNYQNDLSRFSRLIEARHRLNDESNLSDSRPAGAACRWVGLSDAPRADEILLALVMTTGPRVHARVGGLKAAEIKGEDGLR